MKFTDNNSIIATKDGKDGIIDLFGNQIVPFIYDYIYSFSEEKACVEKDGKVGYIDYTGEVVIPLIYEYGYDDNEYHSYSHELINNFGYDYYEEDGYYHYEQDGVVEEYDKRCGHYCYYTPKFINGYAMVKKDGKYGYINSNNEQVIPCMYSALGPMNDYYTITACFNDKYGVIDINNNIVVDFEYDYVRYDEYENKIIAEKGKDIDGLENEIYKFEYEYVKNAIPTPSKIFVDNKQIEVEAYNIDGYNYFKLRDIAYLLDGAGNNLEVTWNEKEESIYLTDYNSYIVEGNELKVLNINKENKKVIPSKQSVYYNNYPIELIKYNIDGYNYVKLRDILKLHDVEVIYNEENTNIYINTQNGYQIKNRISIEEAQAILDESFNCESPYFVSCYETVFLEGKRYFLVRLEEDVDSYLITLDWYYMTLDGKYLYIQTSMDENKIFYDKTI